eukprot:2441347-Ditylum_brightwellii.AAC.1
MLAGITTVLCPCFLGFTFVASGVGTHKADNKIAHIKHVHTGQVMIRMYTAISRAGHGPWPTGGDGNPSPVCVSYKTMLANSLQTNEFKQHKSK